MVDAPAPPPGPTATPVTTPPSTGWSRFANQAQRDVRLWLALMLLLGLVRIALVTIHRGHLDPDSGLGDVINGLLSGMRFDLQMATTMALPALIVSVLCAFLPWEVVAERVRRWWGGLLMVVTIIIAVIDIGYVGEYGNQFDQFIFGLIFDDFAAIMTTIWRSYPVVWALLGLLVFCSFSIWLLLRWLRHPFVTIAGDRPRPAVWQCIVLGIALVASVVMGIRASWGRLPLQEKAAALSPDPFINALTPTPYHALRKAVERYVDISSRRGLKTLMPEGTLMDAAETVFPGHATGTEIDRWSERTAPGTRTKPRHVFLLVMESYDGWSFAEQYRSLGLVDGIRELGKDGILVTSFVAGSTGTMLSIGALLTGLPDAGVHTAWQPSARHPFVTSPAPIFKSLGYRTRFFYSGYLSWQRIGDFCRSQGFDDVIGGGSIDGGKSGNEWGVDDEHLLNFVAANVPDDQPSFNVILSTSYHPPFDVDVYGKGFPLKTIPPDLADRYDGRVTMTMFGHHWYSDRAAARFIRATEARMAGCVFALTGDHWSRRFLNGHPTWPERSLVPLLLYGPQVLAGITPPERMAGSHLDITPTLVELCAPAGFGYHAFGENLLQPKRGLGVSVTSVIGPDFIAECDKEVKIHPLPDRPAPVNPPSAAELRRLFQSWHAIAWWRIMRGDQVVEKN